MASDDEFCDFDDDSNDIGYESNDLDETQDDFEDITMDGCTTSVSSASNESYSFEVITSTNIIEQMTEEVAEVNAMIDPPLSTPNATSLLNHLKWDKPRLYEKYFEDSDKLFKEAKIVVQKNKEIVEKGSDISLTLSNEVLCEICYAVCSKDEEMTQLEECKHPYCNECWTSYLTNRIMSDGVSLKIFCPDTDCNSFVPSTVVMKFVEEDTKKTYNRLISDSFVTSNRLMKWCPGNDCSNAVKVKHVEEKPTLCTCGYVFCFACTENWHAPVNCDLLKMWLKRCKDDSETANWITANTKDCPKCNATIERHSGCNRMRCQKCSFQFCWSCLKDWEVHGYGTSMENAWKECVKYVEKDESSKTDSRAALQKYMFYYDRYMTHLNSLKLEKELKQKVDITMKALQNDMSWVEAQFLQKAWETLGDCRRVLMHTYIFAFYCSKNNHLEVFEDNQRDLQNSVESLSFFLDQDDTFATDIEKKRLEIQDLTKYCAKRKDVLIQHVEEGYEKEGCWIFSQNDSPL